MRFMYEIPKLSEEKSSGSALCEIDNPLTEWICNSAGRKYCLGTRGMKLRREDSCVVGQQRKCDYSLRMSSNSLCQRALLSTFCLSVEESLPLSVLNKEGTEMEWQTLSEYGTFQRKAGSIG